jgi:hypothetical protein
MSKRPSNGSVLMNSIHSEIPASTSAEVRTQALRFAHFTDKVLGRLNRAAGRLCRRCLRELQQNPEHYDQISTYHVDLLARAIRRELDALYSCLRVDSLEMIDHSYQDWIRQGRNRKKIDSPPMAC